MCVTRVIVREISLRSAVTRKGWIHRNRGREVAPASQRDTPPITLLVTSMICHGWEIAESSNEPEPRCTQRLALTTLPGTTRNATLDGQRGPRISDFAISINFIATAIGSVTAWADSRRSSRGPGGDRLGPAGSVTAVPSGWAVAPLEGPRPPVQGVL